MRGKNNSIKKSARASETRHSLQPIRHLLADKYDYPHSSNNQCHPGFPDVKTASLTPIAWLEILSVVLASIFWIEAKKLLSARNETSPPSWFLENSRRVAFLVVSIMELQTSIQSRKLNSCTLHCREGRGRHGEVLLVHAEGVGSLMAETLAKRHGKGEVSVNG